jgi:hypothetical protein
MTRVERSTLDRYSPQNTNYSDADVIPFPRQLDLLALIACRLP